MAIPEALLAFVIIVVLPIRGWHAHHLLERANNDPAVRELLLRRSAVIKWFLAIVAFALLVADDRLDVLLFGPEVAGALFITVGLVGGALIMRRRLSSPQGQERLVHQLRKAASILPYTAEERRRWVWFSVTAGVTEEVIFRAYLIAYLYVVV